MKILLCPDKFKGSISAKEVCEALREGLLSTNEELQITNHPIADGGDGSIQILKERLSLRGVMVETVDPIERPINAEYFRSDDTAFIELASASGLILLDSKERDPLVTSTRGTGIMIQDAMDRGLNKIFLFIGGSATNDAGLGIAQALGFEFLDSNENALKPIGSSLEKVIKINNKSALDLNKLQLTVLCDVTNPMHGTNGAAYVYGAQKGATSDDIITLDKGLKKYADLLKSEGYIDPSSQIGMGAAGAVSASLVTLLGAKIQNGFQMLADITELEEAIKRSDLVITGEGKVDATSFQGKVVGNVLSICNKHLIPCGVIGGKIEDDDNLSTKYNFNESIIDLAKNYDDAMSNPKKYLFEIGKNVGRHNL